MIGLCSSPVQKSISFIPQNSHSPIKSMKHFIGKDVPFKIDLSSLSNKDSLNSLIAIIDKNHAHYKANSSVNEQTRSASYAKHPEKPEKPLEQNEAKVGADEKRPLPNYIRSHRKNQASYSTQVPCALKIISTLNGFQNNKQAIASGVHDSVIRSENEINHHGDYYAIKAELEYSYKEDQNFVYKATMEDKGKAIDNFNSNKNNTLFTWFDGHGGNSVSIYLQKNYDVLLKQALACYKHIGEAFVSSFLQADKQWRKLDWVHVGSTGTAVLITKENNKRVIYTANVGDSRCSYISNKKIERLTYDHRADDPKEKIRIQNSGGIVVNNRVMGKLMLTRAFGDFELKGFGVKCEPFLWRKEIKEEESNKFLIWASDGIWDVLNEQDIQKMIINSRNNLRLSEQIIEMAKARGAWDNLSIFVIKL